MKMLEHGVVLILILSANAVFAGSTPPVLRMHVFDAPADAGNEPEPAAAKPAGSPKLDMVVFSDDVDLDQHPAVVRAQTRGKGRDFIFSYDVGAGYQQDQVDWSVASPSGTPNPLTEVKWNEVEMARLQGGFQVTTPEHFVFKGGASYAWTVDGEAEEINYLGDQRQQAYSKVISNTDQGYSWKAGLGVGYQFKVELAPQQQSTLKFTPLAGYAWQKQQLRMKNGMQRLAGSAVTADANAQNQYEAEWQGPWLGMDVEWTLWNKHQLFSSFEYHWDDYTARGSWQRAANLQHPESFNHQANATGWLVNAGYRYRMNKQFGVQLGFDYQKWESRAGSERLYVPDQNAIESVFNGVKRRSLGVNVGINYDF